ncbi:MAG: hypothetical protein ABIP54_02055 [Candidatus Andersenbacteria bacterium]
MTEELKPYTTYYVDHTGLYKASFASDYFNAPGKRFATPLIKVNVDGLETIIPWDAGPNND